MRHKLLVDGGYLLPVLQSFDHSPHARERLACDEGQLAAQLGARVAADGNVVDILQCDPGIAKAKRYGHCWETSPVLNATKAFFLNGGNKFTVAK